MEKLLHRQILNYLTTSNLLTPFQSGFRPKHGCITALSAVIEEIRCEIDYGKIVFLVLLDHSKAFDSVHHEILCLKLKNLFNFSHTSVKLIKTYLRERYQAVHPNAEYSSWLPVPRGVSQGSILDPLLYIMYSNDLPNQLKYMKTHMYANDVQLYIARKNSLVINYISKINSDLGAINDWATANGLSLNPNKSKCIPISRTRIDTWNELNIYLGSNRIEVVPSAKYLGVVFHTQLYWTEHINKSSGKTYGMLRALWTSHYYTPFKIRLLLAKTYLLPTLLYGCELFPGCSSVSKRKLKTTYNNIFRYVFNLSRYESVSLFAKMIFKVSFDDLLKCRC